MTCEDQPVRLAWEIQMYEPSSQVWICKGYGRATTTADPADIARAVLAGDLDADAVTTDPVVRQALPHYLREALA